MLGEKCNPKLLERVEELSNIHRLRFQILNTPRLGSPETQDLHAELREMNRAIKESQRGIQEYSDSARTSESAASSSSSSSSSSSTPRNARGHELYRKTKSCENQAPFFNHIAWKFFPKRRYQTWKLEHYYMPFGGLEKFLERQIPKIATASTVCISSTGKKCSGKKCDCGSGKCAQWHCSCDGRNLRIDQLEEARQIMEQKMEVLRKQIAKEEEAMITKILQAADAYKLRHGCERKE